MKFLGILENVLFRCSSYFGTLNRDVFFGSANVGPPLPLRFTSKLTDKRLNLHKFL